MAREAHRKDLDSILGTALYSLAFYRNDTAEMSRQVAARAGKPGQDLLLALEADTAAYFGQLGRARELSRQASSSGRRDQGRMELSRLTRPWLLYEKACLAMQTKLDNG